MSNEDDTVILSDEERERILDDDITKPNDYDFDTESE